MFNKAYNLALLIIILTVIGCTNKYNMSCQVDKDCNTGYSCRSKLGGGTECKLINSLGAMSCKNNSDCSYGYSCRSIEGGGTECRTKSEIPASDITPNIIDKKSTSNINSAPKIPEQAISIIEEMKVKCADLGFKPKSERFGKCVLELTK